MATVSNYIVHQPITDNGLIIFTVCLEWDGNYRNFEAYFDKVNMFETAGYVAPRYSPAYIQEMADYLVSADEWVL